MAQKQKTTQGKRVPAYSSDSMAVCLIVGLLLIALGVMIFLATAIGMSGDLFLTLRQVTRGLTGTLSVLLPVIPIWGGVLTMLSTRRKPPVRPFVFACVLMVLICTAATLLTFVGSQSLMDYTLQVNQNRGVGETMSPFLTRAFEFGGSYNVGGGLLGMLLAWPLWKFVGTVGGAIIVILAAIIVFVLMLQLDWKGIGASLKKNREERRIRSEQQQLELQQQELAWQQEQMRKQQEIAWQQEQLRQQQEQARIQQEMVWQQQMQQQQPVWNEVQGYDQNVPIVRQVETASQRRQAKAAKPQIGFQPTPEENGLYPQQPVQQTPTAEPKKKRTGLFSRNAEEDPVAIPRRRTIFDRAEPAAPTPSPAPQPQRRSAYERPVEAPAAERMKPVKSAVPPSFQQQPEPLPEEEPLFFSDEPEITEAPAQPEEPAQPAAPEKKERAATEGTGFLARLKAAKAAAGMPVDDEPAQPAAPTRKSRKDTPSAWSQQETGATRATWRSNEEPMRPAVRPTARNAARTSPPADSAAAARIDRATAPARQKAMASWADTPPWEDSPEYLDVEQPAEVVTPVVTQKAPEGSWQPELKIPPRRQSTTELPDGCLFDEPEEIPYVFPTLDLLKTPEPQAGISEEEDALRSRRLENTLQSFKVPAKVRHITHGPAISRFELEIAPGIKVSRVTDLNRNIAMNMEVKSVRIEAPIPGKSLVGVEVPNRQRATVTLREVLESDVMAGNTKPLVVALGKDIAGTPIVCDLSKMPHLLIAGATGSGKSVCINTIINSLLYRCSPKEVRLILVDPKVVELQCYNGIPHLLIPVVSDPHKASGALAWAVGEMMDRYKRFQERGVRAIDGYNESLGEDEEKMPRIVIVIDELADLMMTCKKDVEDRICRLAQLARAAGIHLIVATQRPSVDVITGLIKANIPSRIAFKVSSNVDSRTILDRIGAEQLLGYGDMLYMPTGEFTPIRVQGCFLSDPEVNRITDFIRENSPSDYDPKVLEELEKLQSESDSPAMPDLSGGGNDDASGDGDLLLQCIEMTVRDGQVSTSYIQRALRLGYARAGRLVDEMERLGIVSQKDGAKPRKCLITREEFEQMKESGVFNL